MAKTEQEINAEKAHKPRPDLVPARALLALFSEPLELVAGEPSARVLDAWHLLVKYRADVHLSDLLQAVAAVVAAIAADGHVRAYATAMMAAGQVMGYGARKHGDCTWRVAGTDQANPQSHVASAERHLLEYLADPSACEEGSGLPVLYHALSQLLIVADLVLDPPQRLGENDGHGTVAARVQVAR